MAVGQFFNPEGVMDISPLLMLQSTYSHKVIISGELLISKILKPYDLKLYLDDSVLPVA